MATIAVEPRSGISPSAFENNSRAGIGLAILRIVLGAIFVYHGAEKLFGGIEGTIGFFGSIGIPAPGLMAWVVGLTEFFGGLALIFGFFAPVAALLLAATMVVAILTVHLPNGFANVNIVGMGENGPIFGMPGWEYNLALIGGLSAIALGGAGRWALRALGGSRH